MKIDDSKADQDSKMAEVKLRYLSVIWRTSINERMM